MANDLAVDNNDRLSVALASEEVVKRVSGALCGFLDSDAFVSQVMISLSQPAAKGQDYGPADCDTRSKVEAAMKLATLALLPSLQQAALIPRKMGNRVVCDVMVQWQGYKALMLRVPEVLDITTALVHVRDSYQFKDGIFYHQCDPFDPERTFSSGKDIVGGFARVDFRDGRPPKFHFAPVEYIEKCRSCAQTQAVWNKWYEQQALKTVLRSLWGRRVINFDPATSERLKAADELEDSILGNEPNRTQAPQSIADFASSVIEAAPKKTIDAPKKKSKPEPKPEPESETASEPTPPESEAPAQENDDSAEPPPLAQLDIAIAERETVESLEELKKCATSASNPFKFNAAEKGKAFVALDSAIAKMKAGQ